MNTSSRPASPSLVRLAVALLLPALLLSSSWIVSELVAQPPVKKAAPEEEDATPPKNKKPNPAQKAPKEEEEDSNPSKPKKLPPAEEEDTVKPKHKVIRVDEDEPKNKPAPVGESDDLLDAARHAKDPVVRDFLRGLADPHDLIITKKGETKRAAPLDMFLGDPPRFTGDIRLRLYLDHEWTYDKNWDVNSSMISGVFYYEQVAVKHVDEFLAPENKTSLSRPEMLHVAEAALESVLRWHESAREQGKRKGDGFAPLEAAVRNKLLDLKLSELQMLADANKWDDAFTLALKLADAYPREEDVKKIAEPLSQVIGRAVEAGNYDTDKLLVLQRRLRQLEGRFAAGFNAQPINDKLRAEAERLFAKAKEAKNSKDALDTLRRAEGIWPRLPGLHDYRLQLEKVVSELRVGVREVPVNLSPGMAWTDSEKRAVELMFESLVKAAGDPRQGQFYRGDLAEGRRLVPLGREFQLPPDAYFSNEKQVTAADVRRTVQLLKHEHWAGYNHAWTELVEDPRLGGDPLRVSLTLRQGFFDPLSLMTFKILPAEPWPEHTLKPEDETRFAQNPVGSGPYQLKERGVDPEGRPFVSFVANPSYGSRASRGNLPHIHEVRFIQTADPVADLKAQKLDLVPDLSGDQVQALQGQAPQVKVLTGLPNLRIYFLAVNHRRPDLSNLLLRQALAHAIDREKILDNVFRPGLGKDADRALNGPYPPGSWACDPTQAYKLDLAKSKIKKAEEAGVKGVKLSLKYPADDPQVQAAMEAIRDQVQKEIGVELALEPHTSRQLHEDVEGTHSYDLAYYHYDYPSDAFWLWPLFDPQSMEQGGTNYLGYANDGDLESQFREVMGHCDFQKLQQTTRLLHGTLFGKMPLIPLWQLDSNIALHKDLVTGPFDPLLLFTDVERWRLDKK